MATPAAHLDSFIKNWHRIHGQSTRLMSVAPSDQFDWRPCETAMPLGELMNHLWIAEGLLVEAAFTGRFPKEHPEPKKTTAEVIAAFDAAHAENAARVAALTPEQLAEEIMPFGENHGSMTRKAVLHAMHEHEIHHRGQLYVYLRQLGAAVPPLFG
jgi:uncharacterized damage-inducible protein DinB